LLVGINRYKAVSGLAGCVADVRNVEGLLRGKFDFPDGSIRVLTDEQATRDAILRAFREHLIDRAEEGDVVVFQYSGHGSRMKDPSRRSPSGWISTIVPHDSRTDGVFDITADELRGLFSLLAKKTRNVTFLFDSCHSGKLLKDVRDASARVRSVAPDPREPPPPPPGIRDDSRGIAEGMAGRDYALVSACRADEVAFEYADPYGNPCGALTHFFVAEVRGANKAGATYRDVMDKVKAKVTGTYDRQHPQLEGVNMDNRLLGDPSPLPQPFVLASPAGDKIAIEAGQVHGMTVGSSFDIYPPGTGSFEDPKTAIARAELVAVGSYRSEATRVGGGPIPTVSRAVERRHSFGGRKVRLHIDGDSGALGRIRRAIIGNDRTRPNNPNSPTFADVFEEVAAPAGTQLLLKPVKDGRGAGSIVLRGGDGTELSPPASVDEAGAIELILDQMGSWARRHASRGVRTRWCMAVADDPARPGKVRAALAGRGRIDPGEPKSPTFAEAFEEVAAPAGARLLLEARKTDGGVLLVLSSNRPDAGQPEVLFQTPTDETGAVHLTLERLLAWARWLSLLGLDNPHAGLDVAFEIHPRIRRAPGPASAGGADLKVVVGQEVEYVVTNKGGQDIYFAILDLATDGSVDVLYPREGANEALAPGRSYSNTATPYLPEGREVLRDYLKVVATRSPVDFRFLQQDGIKGFPRDVDDPLVKLLGEAMQIEKHLLPAPQNLDGWATTMTAIEVVDKP
jgi:hypothetical protein